MGLVEEVGSGMTLLTRGDRVVVPFNVADVMAGGGPKPG